LKSRVWRKITDRPEK